jgi:hypothetical protein
MPVPPTELQSAKKEEVGFSTLFEEWREYIVEDGTRIRAESSSIEVFRIEKTNLESELDFPPQNSWRLHSL